MAIFVLSKFNLIESDVLLKTFAVSTTIIFLWSYFRLTLFGFSLSYRRTMTGGFFSRRCFGLVRAEAQSNYDYDDHVQIFASNFSLVNSSFLQSSHREDEKCAFRIRNLPAKTCLYG